MALCVSKKQCIEKIILALITEIKENKIKNNCFNNLVYQHSKKFANKDEVKEYLDEIINESYYKLSLKHKIKVGNKINTTFTLNNMLSHYNFTLRG